MKGKIKATIVIVALLAMLLIEPLHLKIVIAQHTISGTQDDTLGVWMFSAGTTVPAGAPTCPIIEKAVFYNILDYIGDSPEEVYDFGWGPSEPIAGQEDTTLAKVVEGLSAIDDFGFLADADDDRANFDTGKGGYFLGGFNPSDPYVIVSDGVKATGVLGPSGATSAEKAEQAINGYEFFIFEDAELSGMIITLSNKLGLTITFSIADLQVNPPTQNGADDTLIAIDLDSLPGFDGTFIDTIRIQDDGIRSPSTYGDTTLEIDAITARKSVKKPSTGSIGDTVFLDENRNGVQDFGESGVSGVTLTLNGSNPTLTVGDGYYLYDDLTADTYTVQVQVPSGYEATTSTSHPVVLGTGEDYLDADFGIAPKIIELGRISGVKFEDLNEDGTLDDGEPGIEGAIIRLRNATTLAEIANTTTNAEGYYEFTDLTPGDYIIVHEDLTGYFNTTSNEAQVTLGPGDEVTVNFGDARVEPYPPVANFTAPPACVGQAITFNASSSLGGYDGDELTDITQYRWDFDGDGVIDLIAISDTVMWGYKKAGKYNVTLTVYATGILPYIHPGYIDNDTTQQTVTIVKPNPPVPLFTESPEVPRVNETVTFNATGSQPGFNGFSTRPIIWYFWDFGDGHAAKETDPITTHVYTKPGNYNVTLTVYAPSDSGGCPCYQPYATTWHIKTVRRDGCEIILYPIEDSWVESKCPDANHGTDDELHVKTEKIYGSSMQAPLCWDWCYIRRAYLKFNLSAIPADTEIIHARLYLAVTRADSHPYVEVVIHKTRDDWSEYTITWKNAPTVGDFVSTNTTVNGVCQYYSWDITSYVQGEIGGDGIISLVVRLPADDSCAHEYHRDFGSKEHSNPEKRPYLKIWFICKPAFNSELNKNIAFNSEPNKNTVSTEQFLSLAVLMVCLLAIANKALPYLGNGTSSIKSGKKGIMKKNHSKCSPQKKA